MNNFERLLENDLKEEQLDENIVDILQMAGLMFSAMGMWSYAKALSSGGYRKWLGTIVKNAKVKKIVKRLMNVPDASKILKFKKGFEQRDTIKFFILKNTSQAEQALIQSLINTFTGQFN